MEVADYGALRFWLSVGQWAFNLLIALFLWHSRRHQATNSRLETLEQSITQRVEKAEKDLLTVRGCVDHLPSQAQIEKVGADMRALSSDLGEMRGRIQGINRAVDIINQYLIEQGGRHGQ